MEKSTHTPEYDLVRAEMKSARLSAQLSQRALAARLGTPHSWVAKVEDGERRVDVVELCWLFAACGREPAATLAGLGAKLTALSAKRLAKRGRSA